MRSFKTSNGKKLLGGQLSQEIEQSPSQQIATFGPSSDNDIFASMRVSFPGVDLPEPLSVFYYNSNVSQPYDVVTGKLGGKRQHKPVVIRKPIDNLSAQLYEAFRLGRRGDGVLTLNNVNPEKGLDGFLNIFFEGLIIIGMEQSVSNSAGAPRTFAATGDYEEIKFTYKRMYMK